MANAAGYVFIGLATLVCPFWCGCMICCCLLCCLGFTVWRFFDIVVAVGWYFVKFEYFSKEDGESKEKLKSSTSRNEEVKNENSSEEENSSDHSDTEEIVNEVTGGNAPAIAGSFASQNGDGRTLSIRDIMSGVDEMQEDVSDGTDEEAMSNINLDGESDTAKKKVQTFSIPDSYGDDRESNTEFEIPVGTPEPSSPTVDHDRVDSNPAVEVFQNAVDSYYEDSDFQTPPPVPSRTEKKTDEYPHRGRKPSTSRPIVLRKGNVGALKKEAKSRPFSMRIFSGRKKKDKGENKNIPPPPPRDRRSLQPRVIRLGESSEQPVDVSLRFGANNMDRLSEVQSNRTLNKIPFEELRLDDKLSECETSVVRLGEWNMKYYIVKGIRFYHKYQEEDKDTIYELPKITSYAHKGIVRLYGLSDGQEDQYMYLVLEYMKNGNLRDFLLNEENDLKYAEKVRILSHISETMAWLHDQKNYCVESLQTDSIYLNANPMTNPKLSIYRKTNLFRNNEQAFDYSSKVKVHSYYRAPELTMMKGGSLKSDVFSFGMIMYEVLTENFDPFGVRENSDGTFNFGDVNMDDIALKIAIDPNNRPIMDISRYHKEQTWYIRLMQKCWNADPKKRPTFKEIRKMFLEKVKKLVFSAFVETLD